MDWTGWTNGIAAEVTALLLAGPLMLFALYDVLLSLVGMARPRRLGTVEPSRRFAILVAAHNEGAVIGETVRCLRAQHYPEALFEVFVVADRCSDDTAERAEEAGAIVLRRVFAAQTGKSAAMRALLDFIEAQPQSFDAACIFDADNLVDPNYLEVMNGRLEAGERCIQARLDVKNPSDSWVTGSIGLAYWVTNRLAQSARDRLGLSSALGGTGFCTDWEIARRLGFRTDCLTEDLELQMALVREGSRVSWAHETCIYDEKPLTLAASGRQRVRWMRGHWDVAWRHTLPLLVGGLRKLDPVRLDAALYCLQPSRILLSVAVFFIYLLGSWSPFTTSILIASIATQLIYLSHFCLGGIPILGLVLERVPLRYWRYYPGTLLFGLTWIPVVLWALATLRRPEWSHTPHTRALAAPERMSPALATAPNQRPAMNLADPLEER